MDDPATWNICSESPDIAGGIDTFEDVCREVIHSEWPGRVKPSTREVDMISALVQKCIKAGDERGMVDRINDDVSTSGHTALIAMLNTLEDDTSPALYLRCMRVAFSMTTESQTEIAEEFGVTRSEISQTCVAICKRFNIVPGRGMRSPEACETYRQRAVRVHKARKPRESEPWDLADVFCLNFDTPVLIDESLRLPTDKAA